MTINSAPKTIHKARRSVHSNSIAGSSEPSSGEYSPHPEITWLQKRHTQRQATIAEAIVPNDTTAKRSVMASHQAEGVLACGASLLLQELNYFV